MADYLRREQDSGHILLEQGGGAVLLEQSVAVAPAAPESGGGGNRITPHQPRQLVGPPVVLRPEPAFVYVYANQPKYNTSVQATAAGLRAHAEPVQPNLFIRPMQAEMTIRATTRSTNNPSTADVWTALQAAAAAT